MSEKQPVNSSDSTSEPSALELPVPVTGEVPRYPRPTPAQQFGAPRRFGIGTILIVMGAASLLLAFLIAWGAPAVVVLHVVGFTTLIGFAQVLLFEGKNPRRASIVAGLVICPTYAFGANMLNIISRGRVHEAELFCSVTGFLVIGPLFGYLAGGVVGGIFLLMDAWEKQFGRQDHHAAQIYDPFAPEPVDAEILADDKELRQE